MIRRPHCLRGEKRTSWGFEYSGDFVPFFEKRSDHLSALENFSPEMRDIAERAIYWIGNSIEEHDDDRKVISLCTALETLLTNIADKRKGEALAYRMALLESVLDEAFFYPSQILWIYNLRSNVIHGKSREEATSAEYRTMLTATKRTLNSFIRLVKLQGIKNRSKLIDFLETSKYSGQLVSWLEGCGDQYSKSIREALQESLNSRSGISS